jgi:hypothetical protein
MLVVDLNQVTVLARSIHSSIQSRCFFNLNYLALMLIFPSIWERLFQSETVLANVNHTFRRE